MKKIAFPACLCILIRVAGFTQGVDFTIPDTICQEVPFQITDIKPVNATSYHWSFCSGNANYQPEGVILGNPQKYLKSPLFVTLVRDSSEYYSFITSSGNNTMVRCYFGTSLDQHPIKVTNFDIFETVITNLTGIRVLKDQGKWYGFILNGDTLIRVNFGDSLSYFPTLQYIDLQAGIAGSGLFIARQDGDWIGFITDLNNNALVRLDFGSSLQNDPQVHNLGSFGILNLPTDLTLVRENGIWFALVNNRGNQRICRLRFGASLYNDQPSATVISGINGLLQNAGISLIPDCGRISALVSNCVQKDVYLLHIAFPWGISGDPVVTTIGNIGILNQPYGISEFQRIGDTVYGFVANYGSSEMTRLFFPVCNGASQATYSGYNPDPITYADTGNYNILLMVDEGLPSQAMQCKNIIVVSTGDFSLGPDRALCKNTTATLDAGMGHRSYLWSTGEQTQTIVVDTAGIFWVRVTTSAGCETIDSVTVSLKNDIQHTVDTTICNGSSYWAQKQYQYLAGVYYDTISNPSGCDSIVITRLQLKTCPHFYIPDAFSPNGDGLNDVFRPVCKGIVKYHLLIFDRWGSMVFESFNAETGWDGKVQNQQAEAGIYSFIVTFEIEGLEDQEQKQTGSVTLVR